MNQSAVIVEVSPEEASAVMGGRVVTRTLSSRAALQKLKRIITKKSILRLTRLKNGKYTVRYKAPVSRTKPVGSHGNSGFQPARTFNFS